MASGSQAATYCAQGDEHDSMGGVDETSAQYQVANGEAIAEISWIKSDASRTLFVCDQSQRRIATDWMDAGHEIELLVIGWGSTSEVI